MKKILIIPHVLVVAFLFSSMPCLAASKRPPISPKKSPKKIPSLLIIEEDPFDHDDIDIVPVLQPTTPPKQKLDDKRPDSKEAASSSIEIKPSITVQPSTTEQKTPSVQQSPEEKRAAQDLGLFAYVCDPQLLKEALAKVKDANVIVDEIQKRTALHKVAERLIEESDFSDTKDSSTRKVQCKSYLDEQRQCVALLVQHGARIDQQDKFGNTPLHVAASLGNVMCVQWLLEQKAPVDCRRAGKGWTPLFTAIHYARYPLSTAQLKAFESTIGFLIVYGGARCDLCAGDDSFVPGLADTTVSLLSAMRPYEAPWCAALVKSAMATRSIYLEQQKAACAVYS